MPTTYAETWFPVLVQIIIAIGVAGAMIGLSAVLGRRLRDSVKSMPYESGMKRVETPANGSQLSSTWWMCFILFDIEAIFLYPWAVVYRDLNKSARFFPFRDGPLYWVSTLRLLLHLEEGCFELVNRKP